MIPLRYREVLPPYWYEIDIAERHFSVMEAEMDERQKKMDELRDQFILRRATYALEVWEWIYFRKVQTGSLEERREAIRKKRWAKRPFKLPVLRLLGAQYGKLLDITEDFVEKEIHFEYAANEPFNARQLLVDFEYIRPVHINRVLPIAQMEKSAILAIDRTYRFCVLYPICGELESTEVKVKPVENEIFFTESTYRFDVKYEVAETKIHVLSDGRAKAEESTYHFSISYPMCGEFSTLQTKAENCNYQTKINDHSYTLTVAYPICGDFICGEEIA